MKRLKISLLYDKIYYIAIGVLLVSLFKYVFFLIPIYLFMLRKRKYFKIVLIIMAIFGFRYALKIYKPFNLTNEIKGEVIKVNEKSYTVKLFNQKILLYTDVKLEMGNNISAKGNYRRMNYPSVPFDYDTYYLRNDTVYQFFAEEVVVNHSYSIYFVRNFLLEFFDNNYNERISPYYKSLLLGYNDDLEIKGKLSVIGISHMFAISGLHILLFVKILSLFLKQKYINIFLVCYICITGFSPSVMRASLIVILGSLFKWKKLEFSSLDIFSIVFILLLFVNPYYIFDVGFELSFLISFSLLITEFRPKYQVLQISLLSQIMSLPIVINISNQINILSPIYNVLLVGFFTTIFLPSTLISVLIRNFKPYEWLVIFFEKIVTVFSNFKFSIIKMPSFTSDTILLYYISAFILFTTKKAYYIAIILLCVFFKNTLTINKNVFVFDVGQGDSSLISNKDGNIMIDCFNDSYKFLIKKGIRKLDYLILTHGHEDHVSDALEIKEEIEIDTLVVSYYDDSYLIKQIIPHYDKVLYVKSGDEIVMNNTTLSILAPLKKGRSINNNSIVFRTIIDGKSFLFMGDYEDEEALINSNIESDILKIGHHGSENASNRLFIEKVNPKEAIISVGKYNKYDLPSNDLVAYLEKRGTKVHITSMNGSYRYWYI